jgi:thiol-disulfide isomerase/thioredoxin
MLFFFTACHIPVLETPTDTAPPIEWTAPENRWPSQSPPANIEEEGFDLGQTISDFAFFDQYGEEVSLWQFYGKVILFDVSAEWCAPCKILAEEVQPTQDDYAAQGLVYVSYIAEGNSSQEPVDTEILSKWANDHDITAAPVLGSVDDLRSQLVPTNAYPRLILIDRNLRVIEADIFPQNDETIREKILEAL